MGRKERRQKRVGANLPTKYKKKNKIILRVFLTLFFLILTVAIITVVIIASKVYNFVDEEITSCSDFINVLSSGKLDKLEYTTFIYDKDGNEIEVIHGNENRVFVDYESLPRSVIDAIVSIEDERFFEHKGVDVKRTLGAIYTYITNNGASDFGGSTISQQLVKNATGDKETTVNRKVREWYRATVLEKKFTKKEIFEDYINTIYMGDGAYGLEVAANKYFAKSIKDVNLAESAILAAAIQSPEATNPYRDEEAREKLLQRQKIVLLKMLQLGKITYLEYQDALATNIEFKNLKSDDDIQTYFIDAVIEQVIADLMNEKSISYEEAKKQVYVSGYKIYTTLDQGVQNAIDNTYNNQTLFYTDNDGNFMQSAMVVIDHTNGNVLGVVGGAGEKSGSLSLNRATQSYRQPGSCMKPFGAYGPAFEVGALNPNSYIEDLPITIGNFTPHNYYNSYYGYVPVRRAVALSMNLPAVRANLKVDINYVFNFAKNCGLVSLVNDDKSVSPLALGGLTKGVTPLELASAYATIANGGIYNEPKFYTKVLDKDGNEVLFKTYDSKRVMSENTASMLTQCLRDVVTYGTGYGIINVGKIPVYGKTGNSNDDKDQWFCGFTPYYTIACWNGYDIPRPIGYRSGIRGTYPYTAMILFNNVMNSINYGKEPKPVNGIY